MIILTGPCVLEDRDKVMKIAEMLKPLSENKRVDFYFKASFDKANRTSLNSFRGPGLDEGLKMFQEIKEQFGYRVVTDIHESYQAKPTSEVVDVLQIPAFLCRQTDLLVAAAKTPCKINIKKGQFLAANSMKHPVEKVLKTRGVDEVSYQNSKDNGVWLCERGNTFGYGALVVDMKNLIAMREFAPVIFDATHSAQVPSTGETTGGNSAIVPSLARAAAAVGVDGFFFETHYDPSIALSDGPNMLQIDDLYKTVDEIFAIKDALKL
ncbi:3-deoxy-8-phosphooctulonate synthase [Halarcobacter anaerophilus]|jgi:2-dehydro-3-deoxyphosphooctonate aldolase (KDO 8-P synthase)|uniref:3-deoxy-8-phosphooctulonate synthase n=1 Tax=Halarcobacter anaerophilus TaxID=877500 RepID=A0A4Q0Y613_9BACT|nr:3-deoxy-8-phosphooctulonate synthase [Halarcobacter anaerophilus]QDF29610.1 3-deoxy-D-manno-octulosonate 8-phosphate synthase [Halarcobacter anaerophilus]RXJ64844.1 3-deoxy-8-phosphooctulonate synthase [Halarcobacter anaerophilus]